MLCLLTDQIDYFNPLALSLAFAVQLCMAQKQRSQNPLKEQKPNRRE